jgi:hypothetical protein
MAIKQLVIMNPLREDAVLTIGPYETDDLETRVL